MKHTPTPWEYHHNIAEKYVRIHSGDEATRTDIAYLVTWNDLEEEIEEAAANAALIVKSVNNHEKLVSILQECVSNFERNRTGGCNGEGKTPEDGSPYQKAITLLTTLNQ